MSDKLTIRDHFAAAALTGIIAAADDSEIEVDEAVFISKQAWLVADAMLAARGDTDAAPLAPGVTLTDAEREMLTFVRGIFAAREDNELASAIDALLARAARGTTDHDAAPAARATKETPTRESAADGTGDTLAAQGPVAWGVYRGDKIDRACTSPEVAASWMRTWPERNYRVVPLYAAPPASGVTLTDAERAVLRECADIAWAQLLSAEEGGDEETIARWTRRNVLLRGLLSRAAKEGR